MKPEGDSSKDIASVELGTIELEYNINPKAKIENNIKNIKNIE